MGGEMGPMAPAAGADLFDFLCHARAAASGSQGRIVSSLEARGPICMYSSRSLQICPLINRNHSGSR